MTPLRPALARRTVLTATTALLWGGAATAQPAAPTPRPKGPAVWLDLDQAALDAAYDQRVYAANQSQIVQRYASASERVRQQIGSPQRVAYGPAPTEMLDIHRAAGAHAPIHIFIHGGAWRAGSARDSAFMAELFVRSGAHCVVPDFNRVQDSDGSLLPMADQLRRALVWVHRNAASFGGDARRIHISGHSSGAHLAAVLATTDWRAHQLPADAVRSVLACSGMYDLKPVRLSARSNYVKFSDEMEHALSPQRHLDRLSAPMVVAFGTLETPEFQRQARDFAAAARAAGKPVELLVGEDYNHFELVETLANPYGVIGRAALAQMGLRAG